MGAGGTLGRMLISVRWLNSYLSPGDCDADEIERVLTHAGFPIEERVELPDGDVRLDVEVTSNRGDALSHVGLAREVAAATGRGLSLPGAPAVGGDAAGKATGVEVKVPAELCPRFTARVLRGVAVGPSPGWLRTALESVGLRPVNNVVDTTNYVLHELGQPSHVYDLGKLSGGRLVVRLADKGEPLTTLDGKMIELDPADVVVADAERAQMLAGVIGGLDSSVTEGTTDVLLEVATWGPASVRGSARRHQFRTDASHRYERVVHPGQIDGCADWLAQLILEVAGGELVPGAVAVGPEVGAPPRVTLRVSRCVALLGYELEASRMAELLGKLGFGVTVSGDEIVCEVPTWRRHDVTREVDLIEEVARANGLDAVPVHGAMPTRAGAPQASESASRSLGHALTGMGFYETVTFSFVTREDAALFMPPGLRALAVDEERRKGAPALRPSTIPSLLDCRLVNQNAGVEPGGVRLFETSSAFAETDAEGDAGEAVEHTNLTLLMDAADAQEGVRAMRGVIDTVLRTLGGPDHAERGRALGLEPHAPYCAAYRADGFALLRLGEDVLGCFGVLDPAACKKWPIETGLVAAELNLSLLYGLYPPASKAEALPAFPAIERDLSVVVAEPTPWAAIERAAAGTDPALLEGLRFVGVYRGKPLKGGEKSVTFRLRFRDPERTLRHEEVDPQVAGVVEALKREVGAELRA